MLRQRVQYLWVYGFDNLGRCSAALWNEAPVWVELDGVMMDPDMNMGVPVLRRTEHGMAQYFRFELEAA